ncbi:hypothetical protein ZWY2020_014961 [Hordeum vulgare]|nr:hypothetical protein ZWY2020_014961 [Hordeum vulgare]
MGSEGQGHGFGSGAPGPDIDDLPRNDANCTALTPLWFLEQAALAQPDRASVVQPSGVVLHHRGAYLLALSVAMVWGMPEGLFTCGLCLCSIVMVGVTLGRWLPSGTSICLRQVSTKAIYTGIAKQGVTHFCAAPVVMNNLINAPASETFLPLPRVVNVMVADAAMLLGPVWLPEEPKASAEAFAHGWYHSGDLGVKHPGYIEVRTDEGHHHLRRENISTLEVEKVVYMHPAVLEASVVARAGDRWGVALSFVTLKEGRWLGEVALASDIMRFCGKDAGYWVPKSVVLAVAKTATGRSRNTS